MNNQYFWRLLFLFIALICIGGIVLGNFLNRQLQQQSQQDVTQMLERQTTLLAKWVELSDKEQVRNAQLSSFLSSEKNPSNIQLTIISPSGEVLADSHFFTTNIENQSRQIEVEQALNIGKGKSQRYSEEFKQSRTFVALGVYASVIKNTSDNRSTIANDEPALIAIIRASAGEDILSPYLSRINRTLVALSVLAILLMFLFGWRILRRFGREFENISHQASLISQGQYQQRIITNQSEEMGSLVHSINRLAEHMQLRINQVGNDRNQLSAILSSMVEGVIAIDNQENILYINDAACQLLDLEASRILNKSLWGQVRHPQIHRVIESAFLNQQEARGQLNISYQQSDITVDLQATSFKDNDGQFLGVILVMHDISMHEQLRQMRKDFVANASHELKTPIAAIRGMAETIESDPEMPESIRASFMEKILRQTHRLSNLVSELMDLSKVDNVRPISNKTSIDVKQLCSNIVRDLMPLAEKKSLQLNYIEPETPCVIQSDEACLNHILQNLLDNAIKYTSQGEVSLQLNDLGDSIEFIVKDSGEGISLADQSRIFERFYRVDQARSREQGGNGLGLAIVKHSVERLEGTILVESELRKGTEFTVILPK